MYSLLEIYQEGDDGKSILEMAEASIVNGGTWCEVTDLEETQGIYPGLDIQSLPYFALFDDRDIVFETNNKEEMIAYIYNLNKND